MQVQPYLYFEGRCEEALEFYKKALGAEVLFMMRYSQSPQPQGCTEATIPPEKIMHCSFRIGKSEISASDGRCQGEPKFQGVSMMLNVDSDADAKTKVEALSQGGKVDMPLTETFFASSFAMVTDPFGLSWTVLAAKPAPVPA